MDPELQQIFELAQRAKAGGVSNADIDKALKGRGAPSFAELTRMAQAPQEPPLKPSLLSRIGTQLRLGMEGRFTEGAPPSFGGIVPDRDKSIAENLQPTADMLRMVERGLTLGGSEEARAGVRSLISRLPGGPETIGFGEARQESMRETEAARERLGPGAAFAGEMTGAVTLPAKLGAEVVARGASIGGRMGRGAGVGAVVGGGVGALETPTGEDLGRSVIPGAVGGAAIVGAFGLAAPLVGAMFTVPKRIASVLFGPLSPTSAGMRAHREEMRALGTLVKRRGSRDLEADFAAQYARRPGLVTPADIDPQIGAFAQARAPAATGKVSPLTEMVQRRGVGRGERLQQELPGFAKTGDLEAAKAAAQVRLDALSPQLYKPLEAAYPSVTDPRLTRFLANPRIKKFWNKVKPGEGEPTGLEHWQELRGELSDAISAAKGKNKSFARRRFQRQHEDLTGILEDVVPGFRAANLRFYQTAEGIRQFDTGAQAVKKAWSGEKVERHLAQTQQATGPEADFAVDAFRHGYVDQLATKLLSPTGGKTTAQRLAQMNNSQRRALQAAFGNNKAGFEEFLERAMLEDRLSALRLPTGARAVLPGTGTIESGLASPIVGPRFQVIREFFRTARPVREAAAADASLTKVLSADPQAMARLVAAMRPPGGGGAGFLTAGLPLPIRGLLQSGRQ